MSAPFVEFRDVTVVRDGKRILGPLSLIVSKGESIAIIGRNGSGKTTLSKLIRGDIRPYSDGISECRLFGETGRDIFEYRSKVVSVSADDERMFSDGTAVAEVIMTGFFGSDAIYPSCKVDDDMRSKVTGTAETLSVYGLLEREFGSLSLGEKKTVMIARAMVVGPEAIVLDEPTASLDPVAKADLRSRMDAASRIGISLILITHDLEDIPPGIGRIVALKDGIIAADGRKDDVLRSDVLERVYGRKAEVVRDGDVFRLAVH